MGATMMVRPQRVTFRLAIEEPERAVPALLELVSGRGGQVVGLVRDVERDGVHALEVELGDVASVDALAADLEDAEGVGLLALVDEVLAAHERGKFRIALTRPLRGPDDLALVYTPGVAKVTQMIAEDPTTATRFTTRGNMVAVITDGSAVLGLGDVGPLAALPVMEGKVALLREFGDVDAIPLLVDERDPDRFVDIVARVSLGFGGINLEDISAPRCFEIEGKLRQRLDIPVFHDDQHGTAVVVLAALMNAARVVGRDLSSLRVVVQGMGSAGVAVANLLMAAGVEDLVPVDIDGIVEPKRGAGTDPIRRRVARQANPRALTGTKDVALAGADVFIGVSGGNSITVEQVRTMSEDRIVFALANPTPEIDPDLARPEVRVMATGRSDHPNQINNVLCFPGLFRGLLDAAATAVTDTMKVAAAHAIAGVVGDDLGPDHVIPSAFDRRVAPAVAEAVAQAARDEGHVRPGSGGSRREETAAALREAALRAVERGRTGREAG
jgi:malate dehydrogenase (oxaloacetate-decarboxylating)